MTITTIKLKDLTPSKANPRTVTDAAALLGLAASIKADGLLQNLVVRKGKGKKYEIISGERRYRALKLLEESGDIDGTFPVSVEVRSGLDADDALRLATVENIQREQLAPMDEAEAFARMAGEGADLADIAAKAGVSEATVKRRLAIAALCDEAKEALRSGSVTLSVAEALTLGTAEAQRQTLALLEKRHWADADNVREWLTNEKLPVTAAIFPLEQYTGTLTRDLFGSEEETFFDDMEQFQKLQTAAVERTAKLLKQDGAAFVDIIADHHARWWQYREADEQDAWGAVIHHAPCGRVEVRHGLARCDVSDSVKQATVEVPKAKPEYSRVLLRHMAAQKTLAVQVALLANPRKAKEVAVIQMMNAGDSISSRVQLDVHFALSAFAGAEGKPRALTDIEGVAGIFAALLSLPEKQEHSRRNATVAERLTRKTKNTTALYEAVALLPDDQLDRLHLLLTTLCFGQGNIDALDTNANSLFNRVAADLQVNMADCWRPDEAFLSKRTLEQLKTIAHDSGAASRLGNLQDYKKKGLVEALARYFQRTDDEAAARWLPDAMLFPAKGKDAPQAEEEAMHEGEESFEDDDELLDEEELEEAA